MVRILTDSASDILPAQAALLDITVIPLNVTFEDGSVIRDGIDMTPSEYYAALEKCKKLPTTSQPSPALFERAFAEAAAAGDEVVAITLSEKLSGTCQAARIGAEMSGAEGVFIVDSGTVCLAQALLVRLAVTLRDEGRSAVEIVDALELARRHLHLTAVIDDLSYLRKGGRLPATVAFAGGMLGVKPLIAIVEGKVKLAGSARGLPGAYVAMFKKLDEMGGVNPAYPTIVAYTVNPREVEPLQTYAEKNLQLAPPLMGQIGCVIGTHAGPGAFGMAFFDKELQL